MEEFYSEKNKSYYKNIRKELIDLLPNKKQISILEIGAADGSTLMYLKETNIASKTYGVDIVNIENSYQQNPLIDGFWVKNIENEELDIPEKSLDAIIFPDVLEHLYDPWLCVKKVKKYLKPNGVVIASIPNVRCEKVLKKIIIKGSFEYEKAGVFDNTHIRWFCKKDMINLFEKNGYNVVKITPDFVQKNKLKMGNPKTLLKNKLTFGLLEEYYAIQYFLVCEIKN